MPTLLRLVHVLRRGNRARRIQAWVGLVLITGASAWLIFKYLLEVFLCLVVAVLGFLLVRRSLRGSRPSS